jgi:hypothetical protein
MALYYVSTSGLDSNTGAIGSPFATVVKAARTAAAGDVINIRAGEYTENVIIDYEHCSSGIAGSPIVVQAHPGETVVFNMSGVSLSKLGAFYIAGDLYLVHSLSYWTFRNFTIKNVDNGSSDFDNYAHYGFEALFLTDHLTLENITVHTVSGPGIFINANLDGPSTGIVIDSCTVHNVCNNGDSSAITCGPVTDIEIKNCLIYDVKGVSSKFLTDKEAICVAEANTGTSIHDNTAYNAVCGIYNGVATNSSIYRNYVHDTANGIVISGENGDDSSNVHIYNNVVVDTGDIAIGIAKSSSKTGTMPTFTDVRIYNNTVYNPSVTNTHGDTVNSYIEFVTVHYGLPTIYGMKMSGCKCVNNLVDNHAAPIHTPCIYYQGDDPGSDILIDSNAIYRTTKGGDPEPLGTNKVTLTESPFSSPFLTLTGADLRLKSDSTAIDAANSLYVPPSDYSGTHRAQGAGYDIGAFEYYGGVTVGLSFPLAFPLNFTGSTTSKFAKYWAIGLLYLQSILRMVI